MASLKSESDATTEFGTAGKVNLLDERGIAKGVEFEARTFGADSVRLMSGGRMIFRVRSGATRITA